MSAELALRAALWAVWTAAPDVQALIGDRLFDHIPAKAPYPYVQLGETQALDEDTGCAARVQVFMDVHVWTKERGFVEALRIADALRTTLRTANNDGTLDVPGRSVGQTRVRDTRTLRDRNGIVSHVVLTIESIIDPE